MRVILYIISGEMHLPIASHVVHGRDDPVVNEARLVSI